jgi:hypothetical protein
VGAAKAFENTTSCVYRRQADKHARGNVFDLKAANRQSGLDITPATGKCCWKGEKMDDDLAVLCMLQLE